MKWMNRGHELDAVAEEYLSVKTIYIWGAGGNGTTCIQFLEWLKIDTDFTIYFIDSKPSKQGTLHHGHPILPPEELFARYGKGSIVVSSNEGISEILKEHGIPYFDLSGTVYNGNLFIHRFVCIYLLYKYDKLLSHYMDFNPTTRCTLNCQGCLNFNNDIRCPKDESLESFKCHIDTVFQKIDLCYSFHFCGGDPLLSKELPAMIRYVTDVYGARIFEQFIVTNGTIIPSDRVLEALQKGGYTVHLDDYRDTVPIARERIPQIEEKLRRYGIPYLLNRADTWSDLSYGTEKYRFYGEPEMIEHRDSCNTRYQNFANGRIYSCCYEAFALRAGLADHADFIEIQSTPKKEILEYRLGFTNKGYVDMCRRCLGLGKDAKTITPAVQVPHRYK